MINLRNHIRIFGYGIDAALAALPDEIRQRYMLSASVKELLHVLG